MRLSTRRDLLLAAAAAACAACTSGRRVESIWPPKDFALRVEEIQEDGDVRLVKRRFQVFADGTAVYARATEAIGTAAAGNLLPVFRRVSAYALLRETTRQLARRLHGHGVLQLEPRVGDGRETGGLALRLHYRAFDEVRDVVATGRVRGDMTRVLAVVNAYMPPGEHFALQERVAEEAPPIVRVPAPVDDPIGALACFLDLAQQQKDPPELLLAAFALACKAGRRDTAESVLGRWRAVVGSDGAAGVTTTALAKLLPAS